MSPYPKIKAVRFRGLEYTSDCCHNCAENLCAHSEGLTMDELNDAVVGGAEFMVGYMIDGEFVEERGE